MKASPEIQRADRALRVTAVLACAVVAVAGVIVLAALRGWLEATLHMPATAAMDTLRSALAWVSGSAAALLIVLGIHLWRQGIKVRFVARFPLPGSRVLRDTVVLNGATAVRRGTALQALGAVFALAAVAVLVASWRVISSFAIQA